MGVSLEQRCPKGEVPLQYNSLMGMFNTFSIELLEWGCKFSGILGARKYWKVLIYTREGSKLNK